MLSLSLSLSLFLSLSLSFIDVSEGTRLGWELQWISPGDEVDADWCIAGALAPAIFRKKSAKSEWKQSS